MGNNSPASYYQKKQKKLKEVCKKYQNLSKQEYEEKCGYDSKDTKIFLKLIKNCLSTKKNLIEY